MQCCTGQPPQEHLGTLNRRPRGAILSAFQLLAVPPTGTPLTNCTGCPVAVARMGVEELSDRVDLQVALTPLKRAAGQQKRSKCDEQASSHSPGELSV